MEIKVFCNNCKVEILRADTDTLKSPLVGHMFQVKKDMEWALFSPHDTGNELICPMCEWTFHENGKIKVAVGNEFIIGIPELIIPGILGSEEPLVIELPAKKETQVVKPKPEPEPEKETVVEEATSNPTLEALQKQVEGDKQEEKTEIVPELTDIQSIVEGKPEKEVDAEASPAVNIGDWTEMADANEDSEMNGEPPPGAKVAESGVTKPKQSRKIKKRGSKKKIK